MTPRPPSSGSKKKTSAKKDPEKPEKNGKKKTAKKDTPQPVEAAPETADAERAVPEETVALSSPAMDAADRERLLSGTHHDPHSVLGAHPLPGGVAFRALRPYALSVTVVSGDLRVELHDDGDGFFSGALPLTGVPEYRFLVAYEGNVLETEDAYRLLPALGELDLHLLGEGRTRSCGGRWAPSR